MAIKTGLRTLLLAQSSITTLAPAQTIRGVSVPAVFVNKVPQGFVPPYLRITRIRHDPLKALDGTTGMAESEIDIDCYESTEPEAEALAKAVSDYLKDYSGAAGGSDTIDAVYWDDVGEFEVKAPGATDEFYQVVTLTFTIHHR